MHGWLKSWSTANGHARFGIFPPKFVYVAVGLPIAVRKEKSIKVVNTLIFSYLLQQSVTSTYSVLSQKTEMEGCCHREFSDKAKKKRDAWVHGSDKNSDVL